MTTLSIWQEAKEESKWWIKGKEKFEEAQRSRAVKAGSKAIRIGAKISADILGLAALLALACGAIALYYALVSFAVECGAFFAWMLIVSL